MTAWSRALSFCARRLVRGGAVHGLGNGAGGVSPWPRGCGYNRRHGSISTGPGIARAWEHHAAGAGRRRSRRGRLARRMPRPGGAVGILVRRCSRRELPLALEALRAAATLRRSPGGLRLLGQAFLESGQFAPADERLRGGRIGAGIGGDLGGLADAALCRGGRARPLSHWNAP